MEIRARDTDRELLLEISGDIDHHGARSALKEVEMAIDAALPRTLILDFAGVTFMDSSGIGLIMGRYKQMQMISGTLRVTNVPNYIKRVIRLSGLDKLGVLEREKDVKKEDESHQ